LDDICLYIAWSA